MSTLTKYTADDLSDLSVSDDTTSVAHDGTASPFSDLTIHDQDGDAVVFSGGAEGLEGDADASNVAALLASGRASVYVHSLEMGVDSGDASPSSTLGNVLTSSTNATTSGVFSQILSDFSTTGGGVLELYQTNLSTVATSDWDLSWGSFDWQGELQTYGWVPAEVTLNLNWDNGFDTQDLNDGLALAAAAKALGVRTALPIISPQGLVDGDFATAAGDANERTIAKDLGGLVIDMPSNLFLDNPGGDYQAIAISEIKWAVANNLVVSVLLSPYSETTSGVPQFAYDSTFMAASQEVYSILNAAGALPTQWMVENYAPLDGAVNQVTGSDPNSINSVATWFADNALTAAEPDWFVGETAGSDSASDVTATIVLSTGLSLTSSSAAAWHAVSASTYETTGTSAAVQTLLQSLSLQTSGLGTSTGTLTLTLNDGSHSVTSTTTIANAVVQVPTFSAASLVAANASPVLSGTGTAGTTVTVYDGTTNLGSAAVSATGTWSLTSSAISATGLYDLTATASDGEGDVSASTTAGLVVTTPIASASQQSAATISSSFASLMTAVDSAGASLNVTGNAYLENYAGIFSSKTLDVSTTTNSVESLESANTLFVAGDDLGKAVVTSTASSSAVVDGDGTALSFTGSQNAVIMSGNADDTVLAGAGNDTIDLGSGDNDIVLGTGNSVVYSEGTDSIVAGSGVDTINLSGVGSTVYGGYGTSGYTGTSLLVDDSEGSGSLVFAATQGSVVDGSNSSFTTVVAFGNTTVNGGAAGDHLYAGNGAEITLTGSAANNILVANDGKWANGNFVDLDGSQASGGNQFWAGSGNATLVGGTGQDTLVAGTGSVTMTGGSGSSNDFDFFASEGGGQVVITDFAAADNKVILFGYGSTGIQTALSSAQQVGTSTTFSLHDGTTVTLDNFDKNNLAAADFSATNS